MWRLALIKAVPLFRPQWSNLQVSAGATESSWQQNYSNNRTKFFIFSSYRDAELKATCIVQESFIRRRLFDHFY